MPRGVVKYFDPKKGFGKLQDATTNSEIFAHRSNVSTQPEFVLARGEEVEFELGPSRDGAGTQAINISRVHRRYGGRVDTFEKGWGYITPEDGEVDESVFVHHSDIALDGFRGLEPDQDVEFSIGSGPDGRPTATYVLPDSRSQLERFAYLAQFDRKIDALALAARPEDWTYLNTQTKRTNPILHSYLKYTFLRVFQENKIAYAENAERPVRLPDGTHRPQKLACFNTGLVTQHYEQIYCAFFEAQPDQLEPFVLHDFFPESKSPITKFASRPEVANYFEDPAALVYDRRLQLVKNVHHIVAERLARFPKFWQENALMLPGALDTAINRAEQRVIRNYKTAIPQYNRGKIQLLLPLCLSDPSKADVALVVGKEDAVYKAYTILTLDMAYNNARLLTTPDREWLVP